MGIFKDINQNLFDMYFGRRLSVSNQYDYYIKIYGWSEEIKKNLINKKKESSEYHKTAYQWKCNRIPFRMFGTLFKDDNLKTIPEVIFNMCYEQLKTVVRLHYEDSLKQVIEDLIFHSETNLKYKFKWNEEKRRKIEQIYLETDIIKTVASLLILAETDCIIYPTKKYNLKSDFDYAKVYKKGVIEENFDVLLEDAQEINMLQISCPSLMESYTDFFKKTNKNALMNALRSDMHPKLNMVFIDPECSYTQELMKTFMYGDSFATSKRVIYDSIGFALDLKKQFPGQVCVKTISVPISYSIFQGKRRTVSYLKIDIYNIIASANERCSIIFDNIENKEFYDMYALGFNRIFTHDLTKIL